MIIFVLGPSTSSLHPFIEYLEEQLGYFHGMDFLIENSANLGIIFDTEEDASMFRAYFSTTPGVEIVVYDGGGYMAMGGSDRGLNMTRALNQRQNALRAFALRLMT